MALTEAQHLIRRGGLTATDMVVLAGCDPFGTTPSDIFLSKVFGRDRARKIDPVAALIGEALEPLNYRLLAEKEGLIIRPGTTCVSRTVPWAIATPDAEAIDVTDDSTIAVIETKSVGAWMRKHWGDTEAPLPPHVHIQVQWQMLVRGVRRGYVGAFLGHEHRVYLVEHDDGLATSLLYLGDRFWRGHVLAKNPPPIDGSLGAQRVLEAVYAVQRPATLESASELETELGSEYAMACAQAGFWAKEKTKLQQRLELAIGDREGIVSDGQFKATWRYSKKLDARRFHFKNYGIETEEGNE